jgi:hypothetical protein
VTDDFLDSMSKLNQILSVANTFQALGLNGPQHVSTVSCVHLSLLLV